MCALHSDGGFNIQILYTNMLVYFLLMTNVVNGKYLLRAVRMTRHTTVDLTMTVMMVVGRKTNVTH